VEKEYLYSVIESLPDHLQSKVYDYALSLRDSESLRNRRSLQDTNTTLPAALVLDMHKGALAISDDFAEPLPDSFWLGTDVCD